MLYYEDVKDLGGTTTPTSFWRDGPITGFSRDGSYNRQSLSEPLLRRTGWPALSGQHGAGGRARQRRCSEAELLREAVSRLAGEAEAPIPTLPLFRSTGPSIAEDVDRALEGFGRR
jgi:hypothetical protein